MNTNFTMNQSAANPTNYPDTMSSAVGNLKNYIMDPQTDHHKNYTMNQQGDNYDYAYGDRPSATQIKKPYQALGKASEMHNKNYEGIGSNVSLMFQDPGGGGGGVRERKGSEGGSSHHSGEYTKYNSADNATNYGQNGQNGQNYVTSSYFENCYAEIPNEGYPISNLRPSDYLTKSPLPPRYPATTTQENIRSPDSGVGIVDRASLKDRTIDEYDMYELQKQKRQKKKYAVIHVVIMAVAGIAYVGIGVLAGYFLGQSCK